MEKEAPPSSNPPLGICEKLFNAFHSPPAFRPLRRLTFRQQSPEQPTASDSSDLQPPSTTIPPNAANGFKPSTSNEMVITKNEPHSLPLKPAVAAAPQPPQRATEKPKVAPPASLVEQPKMNNSIPRANSTKPSDKVMPPPTPVFVVPPPPALVAPPPPVTVPQQAVAPARSRRNINERADEFIMKAKTKIRSGSGIGSRVPPSK